MNTVESILKKYPRERKYLLGILHDIQEKDTEKHLSQEALEKVAAHLNITLAAVYGVAEYYSMFSLKKRGKNLLHVCVSPVCRNAGSGNIIKALEEKAAGNTSFTIEKCECLGHCENAAVIQSGEKIYGNVNAETIEEIFKNTGEEL